MNEKLAETQTEMDKKGIQVHVLCIQSNVLGYKLNIP